jgi:hypothetical protein
MAEISHLKQHDFEDPVFFVLLLVHSTEKWGERKYAIDNKSIMNQ